MPIEKIAVVGGGIVGCITSIYAAKLGYEVVLLESSSEVLSGASNVAAVAHFSGSEYPLDQTEVTGKDCVLGGILCRLVFPDFIYTNIASKSSPIRFLLSEKTHLKGVLTKDKFQNHSNKMKIFYEKIFNDLRNIRGWSKLEASNILNGDPDNFISHLKKDEYSDIPGIIYGHKSCGVGINTPVYVSFLISLMRKYNIKVYTSHKVSEIKKIKEKYLVLCNKSQENSLFCVDQVILSAGYNGELIARNVDKNYKPSAQVYLNAACYVEIDDSIQTGLTFTLLGEDGGMFAPLVYAADKDKPGIAQIYLPSSYGSQYKTFSLEQLYFNNQAKITLDNLRTNQILEQEHIGEIIKKNLTDLYPFLENTKIVKTIFKTVINVHDMREIRIAKQPFRHEGIISVYASKWTNALISVFQTVRLIQERSIENGKINQTLPIYLHRPFDISKIYNSSIWSLRNENYDTYMALNLARKYGFPEHIVPIKNF